MKFIVTTDAGFEAARAAYEATSEVVEIESDKIAALVVEIREDSPWLAARLEEVIAQRLQELLARSTAATGRQTAIVFLPKDGNLRAADERAMREAGWTRLRRAS
jgi:hypothetical protein